MALSIKSAMPAKGRLLITTLIAVFALVAQPLYGMVQSQVASAVAGPRVVTIQGEDEEYSSIQSAIDAAASGATVLVGDGEYVESVNISKSITLKSINGPERVTINPASGRAINFPASGGVALSEVTIEGFTIEGNAGQFAIQANSDSADGIYNSTGFAYKDLVINSANGFGLGLFDVEGIVIDDVHISGASKGVEAIGVKDLSMSNSSISGSSDVGFNVWATDGYEANNNLTFTDNVFSGNKTGLKATNASNVNVVGGSFTGGELGVVSSGSTTTVDSVSFDGIIAPKTQGTAVTGYGGEIDGGVGKGTHGLNNLTVKNSTFTNIGRIGVIAKGSQSQLTVEGITYTGKGDVAGLDYAVEFGAGAKGSVSGSTIKDNLASTGNYSSAGVMATEHYGYGTELEVVGNNFSNNTTAIAVGYGENDESTLIARWNNIEGNESGVEAWSYSISASADENWWGSTYGPSGVGSGFGDSIAEGIDYSSWLCEPFRSGIAVSVSDEHGGCDTMEVPSRSFAPVDGKYLNTGDVDLSWRWTYRPDGASIGNRYQVRYGTSQNLDSDSKTTQPSGNAFVTIDDLDNGTYYWQVRAINAPHTSGWSDVNRFTVDTNKPVIDRFEFQGASNGTYNPAKVIAHAKDSETFVTSVKIDTYKMDIDGNWQYTYSPFVQGTVGSDTERNFAEIPASNVRIAEEGTYKFVAWAVDRAGNVSDEKESQPFVVDHTAPTASIEVESPAGTGDLHRDIVRVTGVVDPSEGNIKSHWFEVINPDGTYSYSHNLSTNSLTYSFDLDTSAGDGEYRLRYVATDKSGNRSNGNGVVRVILVHNTAPDAPGNVVVTASSVSGTAEPGSTVTVTVGGAVLGTAVADENGNWSFVFGTPLNSRAVVAVYATDGAGNVSESATRAFTVSGGGGGDGGSNQITDEETEELFTPFSSTASVIPLFNQQATSPDNSTDDEDGEVLGSRVEAPGSNSSVLGAAVDTDITEGSGSVFGLVWYWWLVIVAALGSVAWAVAAAMRRRREDAELGF